MDEDRLTPQLGRLIDAAKAASLQVAAAVARAEGIALLTAGECIHAGHAGGGPDAPAASAAGMALAAARGAGETDIAAAAVAVANDPAPTVLPSAESRRCLADLDPDLPVVFKHRGRWVLLLLSQLPDSQ
ncbi:MAG: hypothetical protein JW990_07580 [Thermoleophilia bacterium]|nr:hypothetical protein [Thermoleophilia bacterium]